MMHYLGWLMVVVAILILSSISWIIDWYITYTGPRATYKRAQARRNRARRARRGY